MGKTYNTINIKHDINSFIANSLTNSGSFIEPSGEDLIYDPNFFAGKNSGEYNSLAKKGAFYADLTSILANPDIFQGDVEANYASQAMAFVPYVIFNQNIDEIGTNLNLFSITNNDNTPLSGFNFANKLATLLPFNIKVEGLIFDNRAKAIEQAAYTFTTNVLLLSTTTTTSTNQIPLPATIESEQCEITLTATVNGQTSITPPPPFGQTPYSYNFTPGNTVEVRRFNPSTNMIDNSVGFNAQVTSFNQFTREITFITDSNTVIGNWGNANRWVVTNQTNNDNTYIVNLALDNIVHFEMQFAAYPIHYTQTGVYPSPADYSYLGFATSGNPTQFSGVNGEYISQVTYRKFWSPSIQDINNPNGISLYGNLFNHVFSVDSHAGSKINPFNLNLENKQTYIGSLADSSAYSLSGGFRREGHVVVRGNYNMY